MSRLSRVLRGLEGGLVAFWCPGCKESHFVGVSNDRGPRWIYNGFPDRPTFTPSIRVGGVVRMTDDEYTRVLAGEVIEPRPRVCHSFVSDGRIRFLEDSTHTLAGQTVDLPEWKD